MDPKQAREVLYLYLRSKLYSNETRDEEEFDEDFPFMTPWYLKQKLDDARVCETWIFSEESLIKKDCSCDICRSDWGFVEYPRWWYAMYALSVLEAK